MKSNVLITRPIGGLTVGQQTATGYFNATNFLCQWNSTHLHEQRSLDNFWKQTHLVEFMAEVAENEFNLKSVDFTELKKILTHTKRGKNGGTYMHPILFTKFAMYLSPKFEYHALRFVCDNMLQLRRKNADNYKRLSSAACHLVGFPDGNEGYRWLGRALNILAFGEHEGNLRNEKGTEEDQSTLNDYTMFFINNIELGVISSWQDLVASARNLFRIKNKLP